MTDNFATIQHDIVFNWCSIANVYIKESSVNCVIVEEGGGELKWESSHCTFVYLHPHKTYQKQ